MTKFIISRQIDSLLIVFPIWIPILYFSLIKLFPQHETMFFILVMIILGEAHFGSTWWLYVDKPNLKWLMENKFYSVMLPLLILFFLIAVGLTISLEAALFFILLFNFFHVTRQSAGVTKIYLFKCEKNEIALVLNIIYVLSSALVLLGLLKFVFKNDFILNNSDTVLISCLIIFIATSLFLFDRFKKKALLGFLSYLTSIFIWLPLIITDKIYHAFAAGVGMHYMQYLAITMAIHLRKQSIYETPISPKHKIVIMKLILYIFSYSGLMVYLSNTAIGKNYYIFLIPVFFQTLHFYADMFIWRFSNIHVRENVGKYLFAKQN